MATFPTLRDFVQHLDRHPGQTGAPQLPEIDRLGFKFGPVPIEGRVFFAEEPKRGDVVIGERGRAGLAKHRRELTRPIILGRAPDCDVAIPDITLSRHHCRLEPSENGRSWQLVDLHVSDLLNDALFRLRGAGARVVVTSGNHDSARRLGVHDRLVDAAGDVGGILHPRDRVAQQLDATPGHQRVRIHAGNHHAPDPRLGQHARQQGIPGRGQRHGVEVDGRVEERHVREGGAPEHDEGLPVHLRRRPVAPCARRSRAPPLRSARRRRVGAPARRRAAPRGGRRREASTLPPHPMLAATTVGRTDTALGAFYRRLSARVGNSYQSEVTATTEIVRAEVPPNGRAPIFQDGYGLLGAGVIWNVNDAWTRLGVFREQGAYLGDDRGGGNRADGGAPEPDLPPVGARGGGVGSHAPDGSGVSRARGRPTGARRRSS